MAYHSIVQDSLYEQYVDIFLHLPFFVLPLVKLDLGNHPT